MLPIFVVLCLATTQIWGAAIVNNAHVDGQVAYNHEAASSHSDGEYHESSSTKDSAYNYDKGSGSGHVDGHVAQAYNNGHGAYGAYPYGYAPAAYAAHGAYQAGGNQDYEYSYDKGQGYNKETAHAVDYKFNNDAANEATNYAANGHQGHYNNYVAPSPYYYGHPVHKRSVAYNYGYPAYGYGYNYGYPAAHGYYGNHHAGYYGNHAGHYVAHPLYHALHKRSVGYPYSYQSNYYGYPAHHGYYGNHYAGYPYTHGYNYGYPAHH